MAPANQPFFDEFMDKDGKTPAPAPIYVFAGTSMGNEGVHECGDCGALVRDPMTARHSFWHAALNTVLIHFNE